MLRRSIPSRLGQTVGPAGVLALAVAACSEPLSVDDGATTTGATNVTTTGVDSGSEGSSRSGTAEATTTPSDDASSMGDDETGVTPPGPDLGEGGIGCDPFAQNCPAGQKCAWWANDGGPAWNSTRCVSVVDDPAQVGEPCTLEVDGGSPTGNDDCDVGAMCFFVDESSQGTCLDLCQGSARSPSCPTAGDICKISAEGMALCLPPCDPVGDDCPEGQGCYPDNEGWLCAPDASGDGGAWAEPCEFINACDAGLVCIDPPAFADCEGAIGCCSPTCDLGDRNADAMCAALDPAASCVPFYEPGPAPAGYEHVGLCSLP